MSLTAVLARPWFWILFVVLIVVALYLYGVWMLGENTELAQTHKQLASIREKLSVEEAAHQALRSERNRRVSALEGQVSDLTRRVAEAIDERDRAKTETSSAMATLTDCIKDAERRAAEAKAKGEALEICRSENLLRAKRMAALEATIASPARRADRDKSANAGRPSEIHRGGQTIAKGHGRIIVYSLCATGGPKHVWIDGRYAGLLTNHYSTRPTDPCGEDADVLSKVVPVGEHDIRATGSSGSFRRHVSVAEGECSVTSLVCP